MHALRPPTVRRSGECTLLACDGTNRQYEVVTHLSARFKNGWSSPQRSPKERLCRPVVTDRERNLREELARSAQVWWRTVLYYTGALTRGARRSSASPGSPEPAEPPARGASAWAPPQPPARGASASAAGAPRRRAGVPAQPPAPPCLPPCSEVGRGRQRGRRRAAGAARQNAPSGAGRQKAQRRCRRQGAHRH